MDAPTINHSSRNMGTNPTYRTWWGMMQRCLNEDAINYENYGGRGITVDAAFQDYRAFLDVMGPRPAGKTLDRIDPNGPYSPENCRWATHQEQSNNRNNTRWIEFDGVRLPLVLWADRIGISPHTLRSRLHSGWSIEKALTSPRDGRYSTKRKSHDNANV